MADVKSGANPLFLREEELRRAMELLFFAYRDFTAEPDRILTHYNYGRAHHRVIYFVGSLALGARVPDPWPQSFGYHEVWHVLVVVAVAMHFVVVVAFAIPRLGV